MRPYSNDLSNLWVTPRAWIVARVSCFELLRRGRIKPYVGGGGTAVRGAARQH